MIKNFEAKFLKIGWFIRKKIKQWRCEHKTYTVCILNSVRCARCYKFIGIIKPAVFK